MSHKPHLRIDVLCSIKVINSDVKLIISSKRFKITFGHFDSHVHEIIMTEMQNTDVMLLRCYGTLSSSIKLTIATPRISNTGVLSFRWKTVVLW